METAAVAMALCCGLGRGGVHPSSGTEFSSSCVPHIFLHPAALFRVPCNLLLCYWGKLGPTLKHSSQSGSIAHWVLWLCLLITSHLYGISWLSIGVEDSPIPMAAFGMVFHSATAHHILGFVASASDCIQAGPPAFPPQFNCLSGFPHDPCITVLLD